MNVLTYIIISITVHLIKLAAILRIMSYLNLYNHVYDINGQQTITCQRFENYWQFRRKKRHYSTWLLTYIGIPLGDKFSNYIIWLSDYRMGWVTRLKVKALFQDENLTTLSWIFNIIVAYDIFDITFCNFIIKYNATFIPYL